MINPNDSPLNEQHLVQIVDKLAIIDRAMTQVELAKRAGISVATQEQQLQDARAQLLKIKSTYFPNA